MDLPSNVGTGMVHGQFIVALIDGDDADQEPDVIPASGSITFTASVPYLPNATSTPNPVTIMKGPIRGVFDSEGYLCTPHPTTGEIMYRGVRLVATDDADLGVTDWTWTATYRFDPVNSSTLQIPAHSFALPDGATVDLTTVVKVPSSPGYGLPQAEAAVLRAEQAALQAEASAQVAQSVRDDADAGVFDGDQGLPGNATMRIDTTVGTRVFITDGTTEHLVSGETGEIDISALLASGVTADSITVARTGRTVTLSVLKLKVTTSGSQNIFTSFPTGFRPTRMQEMRIPVTVGTGSIARLVQVNRPNTWYSGASNSDAISFQVTYYTADSWPTATPPIA